MSQNYSKQVRAREQAEPRIWRDFFMNLIITDPELASLEWIRINDNALRAELLENWVD